MFSIHIKFHPRKVPLLCVLLLGYNPTIHCGLFTIFHYVYIKLVKHITIQIVILLIVCGQFVVLDSGCTVLCELLPGYSTDHTMLVILSNVLYMTKHTISGVLSPLPQSPLPSSLSS